MNSEYFTPSEIARILKVTPKTINNMIHSKKIKAIEICGDKRKSYRILKGELDRFVAEEYSKYD